MRNLFASERRCVFNLFEAKWNTGMSLPPTVLTETIAEPSNPTEKPWFNCDFILHFVDWRTFKSERSAAACSVLPNALGAELFLIVERATLSPTALELNGGAAFPIKHYRGYIDIVEAAIRDLLGTLSDPHVALPKDGLPEAASVSKAAFARLLVVGSDVTFLYLPQDTTPVARGQRINLVQTNEREIDFYLDGEDVVCFDGWIRIDVVSSERVLVSLPDQETGNGVGSP